MSAAYLRRQAETCLWLARTTFDLTTATRLRHLANDLSLKADEMDSGETLAPHLMNGSGSSRNGESEHG